MNQCISTERKLKGTFHKLISEHFTLIISSRMMSNNTQKFKRLLDGFTKAHTEATKIESAEFERHLQIFKTFFPYYHTALERWRKDQEDKADDFNLLEVMELTRKEVRHSMILAWLLDKELVGLGTHAQGKLGFRLFLEEVGLPGKYADGNYHVTREQDSDESRVDIEVAEKERFVIHIENKILAPEGENETNREWRDLERRAKELGCQEYHAFYLTPDRKTPENPNFHPISWRQIAKVLDKFEKEARAEEVRLFARHYAKILRTHIIPEIDNKESNDACK
jgi:hypothetical protein